MDSLSSTLPSFPFIYIFVRRQNVKFRKGQSQGGKQGHAVIFKNWNAQVLWKLSSDCREINLIISVMWCDVVAINVGNIWMFFFGMP